MPGYDKMRRLSSLESLTTRVKVGTKVELTIDLFTAVGVLVLVNSNKEQLEKDIAEVRKMEKDGLFTFEDQIDPAQYMVKKDSIDMDESFDMMRRRSSIPSNYSSKAQVYKPPVPTYGIAAAAFAAGLLVGFMARR
jgi:hypothetical protein